MRLTHRKDFIETRSDACGHQFNNAAAINNDAASGVVRRPAVKAGRSHAQPLQECFDLSGDVLGAPHDGKPQKTVVRTGTANGRKVVQYSDGTTDYAD